MSFGSRTAAGAIWSSAGLNRCTGLSAETPDGAFYVFASCTGLIGAEWSGGRLATDVLVADFLLAAAGVAVVPGSAFLASPYIRLSYAASDEPACRSPAADRGRVRIPDPALLAMTADLRSLIAAGTLVRAMAVHSPLSALLAAEAGFEALWASGFELSALYGVADSSLLTMTQHLDMVRAIVERTPTPVVADVDTGYGNAVNVHRTVRLYERAGASAVVLEDKTFPKTTSLMNGARQDLVRMEEFVGKISAALDARSDARLLIIGRTEALIAGLGTDEALRRAEACATAGADLIMVHSKASTPEQFEAVAAAWKRPQKLVVVPTAFPTMTTARIGRWPSIGMVIYGNHAIRASSAAMRRVFHRIADAGGAAGVDAELATVQEMFELQNTAEVESIERRFVK